MSKVISSIIDPWLKCGLLEESKKHDFSTCTPIVTRSVNNPNYSLLSYAYWPLTVAMVGCFGVWAVRRFILKSHKIAKCTCQPNITTMGPRVLITGSNSGIGKATAIELLKRKCRVHMTCRNFPDGLRAKEDIIRTVKKFDSHLNVEKNLSLHLLDLASAESIYKLVQYFKCNALTFQILINNAGIFPSELKYVLETGMEESMAVNHLGHFRLTKYMLDAQLLQPWKDLLLANQTTLADHNEAASELPRIIIVTSSLAKQAQFSLSEPDFSSSSSSKFNGKIAYANSKLANCLFARELHQRYHVNNSTDMNKINVYCVHTNGMIYTGLFRHTIHKFPRIFQPLLHLFARLLLKTPQQGCQNILHCAISPNLVNESGYFYSNCQQSNEWPINYKDDEDISQLSHQLWEKSLEICENSFKFDEKKC